MTADPFGTGQIRRAVLAAWSSFPSRFVEDLNAEQDYAHGAYRDRLLVELAQNAADAAAVAGVPGDLLLELDDEATVLRASNTGAALDAAGVAALASLRASSKPGAGATVGRFGVGFSAVLEVTDCPQVHSRTGSIGFSRTLTADEVARIPELQRESLRHGGKVPVLRLPFPVPPEDIRAGYATCVVLPLLPAATPAVTEALRELASHPEPLLLGLPSLDRLRIRVDGTECLASRDRYLVHEEQGVVWAVPAAGAWPTGGPPGVLHAPTATDEPVSLPALLIAEAPLEPGRRHVRREDEAASIARRAGVSYAGLLQRLAESAWNAEDLVAMMPTGIGQGWFDTTIREAANRAVLTRPLLPAVGEPGRLIAPADAVTVASAADLTTQHWALLAGATAGLVRASPLTATLGVATRGLDELVDALAGVSGPDWPVRVAPLLQLTADPVRREELALLPVPLADGRVARGARRVLLPEPGQAERVAVLVAALGISVEVAHAEVAVAAAADDEVGRGLQRLGMTPATASSLLGLPQVRDLVDEIVSRATVLDDISEADERVSAALLDLVVAAWQEAAWLPGERVWLRDLLLPDSQGYLTPARAMLQPGSPMAEWLHPDDVITLAQQTFSRLPAEAWRALAVADEPLVEELLVEELADIDPDAMPEWLDSVGEGARAVSGSPLRLVDRLAVIRDLDLIEEAHLPAFLDWVATAAGENVRRSILTSVRIAGPSRVFEVPSPAAAWLSAATGIAGTLLVPAASGEDAAIAAQLFPTVPSRFSQLPAGLLCALGATTDERLLPLDTLLAALDRMTPETVTLGRLLRVWQAVAHRSEQTSRPPSPTVWAVDPAGQPVRVTAEQAVVVDGPHWLQLNDLGAAVVAPVAQAGGTGHDPALRLAEALDLECAWERADGVVTSTGVEGAVPEPLRDLLQLSAGWMEHEELTVDGQSVGWWVDDACQVHADTATGLADGLAWAAGRWHLRHAARAVMLGDPEAARRWVADGFALPDADLRHNVSGQG